MSLRSRLSWAFMAVAFLALLLSVAGLSLGLYSTMMRMHGSGSPMPHNGMMTGDLVANATIRWSLLSSLIALLAAAGAGYFSAERITRSLRSLRDTVQRIDLRDLSQRVPVQGADEIADLATTFNRMAERLEAEDRSRRHLLADVAHELRHPLAIMQGRLDLILDGKVELDPSELVPLQDEITRMKRMVGDLRDLSLAEVGKLPLHKSRVDLSGLMRGLMQQLLPVADERAVRFVTDLPEGLPAVEADPDRVKQVFLNLLTNALQHSAAGDEITVRAWSAGGAVRVAVADTGPGIEEEHLPHLFDRFYRVDTSRSRESGGSGLGLAIVRGLVELHGGQVEVQSRPGAGATFTVSLPAIR